MCERPAELPKVFPIQNGVPISWEWAEKAYETYAAGAAPPHVQSLEELAHRGGFGLSEWACLYLGHQPHPRGPNGRADACITRALLHACGQATSSGGSEP